MVQNHNLHHLKYDKVTISMVQLILADSLVAVPKGSLTCTVISVDDGLLRTSTGCTDPPSSLTLYVDCSKLTKIATKRIRLVIILSYSTIVAAYRDHQCLGFLNLKNLITKSA